MKQIGFKEYGLIGSGDGAKEKLYKTDDGKYILRGIGDRGVKTAAFYVIKNTEMPAVLLEHGFYTNKTEVQYLKSDDFRNRLAQSDAAGIIKFFNHFR